MSVGAYWTQRAEAALVVWAYGTFEGWIRVLICAIVASRTCLMTLPVVALGHFAQIKGVQELAVFAFLAQSSQKMFAY